MPKTFVLRGTPVELGEQLASALFGKALAFASEQLTPQQLEEFCCSYIATTAGLMARRIGKECMADIAVALAHVADAEWQEWKGPMQ